MNIRENFLNSFKDFDLLKSSIEIIDKVKRDPKKEILNYYRENNINRKNIIVTKNEIINAVSKLKTKEFRVLKSLRRKVSLLAKKQSELLVKNIVIQDDESFYSELIEKPLETIGIYIPRNLPSSLIYYCELAKFAGVKNIILALPPEKSGEVNPYLLAAASLFNVKIIAVGGRRAFPILAFGASGLIPDKLFGPCNLYVDHIKEVLNIFYKIPIDIPSGPSELLVFCDENRYLKQVEYDLRAQMEHGEDSRGFFITTEKQILNRIINSTKDIKEKITYIFSKNYVELTKIINEIAPEILEIFTKHPKKLSAKIKNAGNIYINICSPLGDYCVIGKGCADPTYGMAKGVSGITLRSFTKTISVSERKNSNKLNTKLAEQLSEIEGFKFHQLSIKNL